jgi:SAM-dependent methyltransferase
MGIFDKRKPEAAAAAVATAALPAAARASNGLKDFLWLLGEVERGRILDLGPVSQSTVGFFTSRGLTFHCNDLLQSWREFLRAKEAALRSQSPGTPAELDTAQLAAEFVEINLPFEPESFHAVLLWDLCDHLEPYLLAPIVERLHLILRPGGVLLGVFHNRAPETASSYRVLDAQHIEVVPAPRLPVPNRFLQNRDILNLFAAFRSSKTYVARDQVREGLFTR